MNQTYSLTISNLTAKQFAEVSDILEKNYVPDSRAITATTSGPASCGPDEVEGTRLAPKGKRGRPAKTVSPDEAEEFGTKALVAEELAPAKKSGLKFENFEDIKLEEEEAEEVEQDDDAPAHDWDEMTDVINQFGAKNPKAMKEILNTFNFKTTKELKQCPNRWDAVYTRVKKQLKALKKSRD